MINRKPNDPQWFDGGLYHDNMSFGVPSFWFVSWYDVSVAPNIALFNHVRENGKNDFVKENQYLVINKLINEENIDKAFSDLEVLQKNETKLSARSQILIGKIYLALEQPAKAFSFFEQATFTSVSTDDLAYAGMSMSAIKLGKLSEAKTYAEKALNENPDLVEAKLALGLVFTDYGQVQKAETYFKKAILASRNSLMSVRTYASSKMRQGRYKEARNIITNALLEQKSDAATTDLLGKIFWIEGDIKEAVRLRSEASEMFRKSGNIERAEKIHHLRDANRWGLKKNEYLFSTINENEKKTILFQGDSWIESISEIDNSFSLLKKFGIDNNYNIYNAGITSVSYTHLTLPTKRIV